MSFQPNHHANGFDDFIADKWRPPAAPAARREYRAGWEDAQAERRYQDRAAANRQHTP